ncbi:hypothetical protein ElyMa_003502100 [Elysia marginata]|uniref:Uncharacterized protein n=1 Tax=Elysia marginata TaxID=1093978 RepID=A0AAV4EEC0_9GAST|nr:hypothetical protein ElyMa_003502100 [Elysia marginata]
MVDGMFSVIHGKNVWSLKSMFRRALTLGEEERSMLMAVDDSDNAEYAFDCDQLTGHTSQSGILDFLRYGLRPPERASSAKNLLATKPPSVWRYGFSVKSGRPGVRIM